MTQLNQRALIEASITSNESKKAQVAEELAIHRCDMA
jgi:hypothetical protein